MKESVRKNQYERISTNESVRMNQYEKKLQAQKNPIMKEKGRICVRGKSRRPFDFSARQENFEHFILLPHTMIEDVLLV